MGKKPDWSYLYTPTAVEWAYWFGTKQDELNLPQQSLVALRYGINAAGGLVGYSAAGVAGALGYTPLSGANNLTDLSDAAASRTNLGLKALATVVPGTGVAVALSNNTNSAGGVVTMTSAGTLPQALVFNPNFGGI